MTQLTYNNNTGRYQATVDGDLIEVDGDEYVETRREIMKDMARVDMDFEGDLADLPENDYNRLYDAAEKEIESAEGWLDVPKAGLYINGEPQFDV